MFFISTVFSSIMQIALQQLVPSFFDQDQKTDSQIWRQQVTIQKGERLHLIAPSGSGKTSLVHFLYGMRHDYNGTILYDRNDIKQFDAEKFAIWRQQHLSIVFQDLRLFQENTVEENILVKRNLCEFEAAASTMEMLQKLGLGKKLKSLCKHCSYGEQQRIAIIRSLQQPFDFILLDEPFSHLDEHNRHLAMELIEAEAAKRKAAIILADLKQIEYFNADRILFL